MFVMPVHKPFTSGETLWIQCQTNFVRFTLRSVGHKQQNILPDLQGSCSCLETKPSEFITETVIVRTWEIACSDKNGALSYNSFSFPLSLSNPSSLSLSFPLFLPHACSLPPFLTFSVYLSSVLVESSD